MPGPGAGPGLGTFALLPGALPLSLSVIHLDQDLGLPLWPSGSAEKP